MKSALIPVCIPALLLLGTPAVSDTFVENDGFVWFEAEAGEFTGNWLASTDLGHYSGDSYIIWEGPDLFNSSQAGQDTIQYQFEITTPGNYELRWRSRIGKGDSSTESNDSWVRFPSGVNVAGEQPLFGWSKVHMGHTGAWFWDARVDDHAGASVRQYFPAGIHTMEVSGRSNGHAIDKIALFKYDYLSLSPSDLDTRSGTPQTSVDGNAATIAGTAPNTVKVVASGLNYTPGECMDDSLALAPVADVHSMNGNVVNQIALAISPQPAKGYLRFDLAGATGVYSAALEIAIDSGEGEATIEVGLLNSTNWQETQNALVPEPQNVLQLSSVNRHWQLGKRYALTLPAQDLPSGQLDISVATTMTVPAVQLSMASRENSQHMPLLILKGNEGFCTNYWAALATVNDEATETPSEEEPTEHTAAPEPNDTSSSQPSNGTTAAEETVENSTLQANQLTGNTETASTDSTQTPATPTVSSGGSFGLLTLFSLMAGLLLRRWKGSEPII